MMQSVAKTDSEKDKKFSTKSKSGVESKRKPKTKQQSNKNNKDSKQTPAGEPSINNEAPGLENVNANLAAAAADTTTNNSQSEADQIKNEPSLKQEIEDQKFQVTDKGTNKNTVCSSELDAAEGDSWSSWLQGVKGKTLNTIELVRQDLTEFSGVVQNEVVSTGSALAKLAVLEDPNPVQQANNWLGEVDDGEEKMSEAQESHSEEKTKEEADENESVKNSSSWWDNLKQQANDMLAEDVNDGKQPQAKIDSDQISKTETEDDGEASDGDGWNNEPWWQSLVTTVNKALLVTDTTQDEQELIVPEHYSSHTAVEDEQSQKTTSRNRLFAIQANEATFGHEPGGAPELFDDWLDTFDLAAHQQKVTELLGNNPSIRNVYAKLVPSEISNSTFWQRYFYRLHQFGLDEALRAQKYDITANFANKNTVSANSKPERSLSQDTSDVVSDGWSVCSNGESNTHTNINSTKPTIPSDTSTEQTVTGADADTQNSEHSDDNKDSKNEDWVDWGDEDALTDMQSSAQTLR